jgi:hypothetical protein
MASGIYTTLTDVTPACVHSPVRSIPRTAYFANNVLMDRICLPQEFEITLVLFRKTAGSVTPRINERTHLVPPDHFFNGLRAESPTDANRREKLSLARLLGGDNGPRVNTDGDGLAMRSCKIDFHEHPKNLLYNS